MFEIFKYVFCTEEPYLKQESIDLMEKTLEKSKEIYKKEKETMELTVDERTKYENELVDNRKSYFASQYDFFEDDIAKMKEKHDKESLRFWLETHIKRLKELLVAVSNTDTDGEVFHRYNIGSMEFQAWAANFKRYCYLPTTLERIDLEIKDRIRDKCRSYHERLNELEEGERNNG